MNRRIVFDTNRLINYWYRCQTRRLSTYSEEDATGWAREFTRLERSDAIFTPVHIEFLCGTRNQHEFRLSIAFLSQFRIVDDGRILDDDWTVALRLASRIPPDGARRQLVDCLLDAIARRLNYELVTGDKHLSRSFMARGPNL